MLRVNKKAEYGIIALLFLASEPERVASVREISEACHVPETLLSKIMQRMKRDGFVAASHGNQGGYRLAKDLSQISLLDITRVLVGPVQVAECLEPGNHQCPAHGTCRLMTPMTLLNQKIVQLFESTSLETLSRIYVVGNCDAKENCPMKLPIYMDNHATTPLDPRVLDAMMPYLTERFGNAASRSHPFGWEAEEAVEKARAEVAAIINANPKEIVFTSGATESINIALKGAAEMYSEKGNHIITVATEHKATLDSAKWLEKQGLLVTYLPVDTFGMVRIEDVQNAITDKTILISAMHANNEIGTINPIAAIGRLAKEKGILFHVDAAQTVGKIPVDVQALGVDILSISGHKLYGPKGIGAMYVRRSAPRVRLSAVIHGGGHERGFRSGTLNVPGIVGLGTACRIARETMAEESAHVLALRKRLQDGLFEDLEEIYLNGHPTERLPGNLNVSFAYVEGEAMMMGLKEVAVSSGSACTSASLEPSYVLKAMGVGEELAHTSIRFGIGRFNTEEEVDFVRERVVAVVRKLRDMSPLYEMAKEGIDLKSVRWTAH